MDRKLVDYRKCVADVVEALADSRVLLVSAGAQQKPNAMAIGWGTIGVIWQKPVFIALVRPTRYTFGLINETGDFTVNVAPPALRDAVLYCGQVSGRGTDKLREKQLTTVPAQKVKAPIIKECTLNLECRVMYQTDFIQDKIIREIVSELYPKRDFHRLYFGEILACWKT